MSPDSLSVLLVEPDRSYARFLTDLCTRHASGVRLTHVTALTLAFASLADDVDAVLIDLAGPADADLDVLDAFRRRVPLLPVVALVATDDAALASRVIEAGAQDCLVRHEAEPTRLVPALRHAVARSRAEQGRRLREARELFESDLTANFIATRDGSIEACNETFAQLLRYPDVAAARRVNAAVCFDGADRWQDFVAEVATARAVRQREMELRAADGSRVHALASAVGVFDDRWQLLQVRGQFYDLTAHKQLELRFSQLQKFEAIGRLAGGIAHDFNNLLTLIGGRVERLQRGLPPNDPLRKSVDEVASAAERAAGLTLQLLAFSRRQVLAPKVISLNAVVHGVHGMLTRLLGEHVTFELALAADVSPVRADPGRIEQALLNLAINARDAMPNGGVLTVSTTNVDIDEIYARQHVAAVPGPYVRLSVSDTGTGMDRETRERVFEPFFTTKEVGKGTGLGLSTVYGIVKQSGGHIWVYSEVGLGTTFKIYLPAVDAPIDVPAVAVPRPVPKGSETVLLVEDEDGVRELIDEVLTARGYHVLAASRGVEALQIAEFVDEEIHLLVTDVVMPQMSGREVAMRLAPGRPGLRVLYLSGYTDDLILQHGALEPGAAFLQKPFGAADLARKVREVLSGAPE